MLSPRLLTILALATAVAAVPATDKPIPQPVTTITDADFDDAFPWYFPFGVSSLKNLFTPFLKWFPSFEEIGPRVEADDKNFRVITNVNDYKKEDLKVKVRNVYIQVQGSREAKHDDHDLFASQFFHTYTLPANASGADVTATLTSDGYLIVDAPINPNGIKEEKDSDRDVPIVESGKPLEKKTPKTTVDADTDKEATTPSDREEVTEKDNDIPHGTENEIQP